MDVGNSREAFEEVQSFPSRKNFNKLLFVVIWRVLHRLEDYTQNERKIVFKMFNVLALHLLHNAVHDVHVHDLLS